MNLRATQKFKVRRTGRTGMLPKTFKPTRHPGDFVNSRDDPAFPTFVAWNFKLGNQAWRCMAMHGGGTESSKHILWMLKTSG